MGQVPGERRLRVALRLVCKFGLSWRIVPVQLMELLSDKDPVVAKRVLAAMMTMTKIETAALVAACRG